MAGELEGVWCCLTRRISLRLAMKLGSIRLPPLKVETIASRTGLRVRLFVLFLGKKSLFSLKKSVFIYLDNFLKIIRFSKKSVFSFFGEAEKSSF